MTAVYDFFRYIKLYSTDGVTLEHTIEADAVTDTLSISRGAGVAWTGASAATDSFKIDVNYQLEVPVSTTTLRLTDVNSVDQDIVLVAGTNMNIVRDNANQLTISSLVGGVSKSITSITQANPAVVQTTNAHNFTEGTPVTITDVVGMTQLNGNEYYMNILTGTTFSLYTDPELTTTLDSTGFGAYTSGGVATAEYAGARSLNELSDVLANVANFTNSIKIGDTTTGTLNAADNNIIIGVGAANAITHGDHNVIIGHDAHKAMTWSGNSVVIGNEAVEIPKGFISGVSIGSGSTVNGDANATIQYSINIGYQAGSGNTQTSNINIGAQAGEFNDEDNTQHNIAIGQYALKWSKSGGTPRTNNIALGYKAGQGTINFAEESDGIYIGYEAGVAIKDGSNNIFIGKTAGDVVESGSGNVIIGDYSGTVALTDTIAIYTGGGTERLTIDSTGGTLNGNSIVTSNSISGTVTGHIIPDTNIAYDLGSSTHKFRDLYLDGTSLHLGSTILRDDGAGNLQANLTNILQIAADDSTIRTINSGESVKFVGAGSVTTATDAEGNLTITGSTNIVNDTTPQLGGELDAQDNNITNTGNIGLGATSRIDLGSEINISGDWPNNSYGYMVLNQTSAPSFASGPNIVLNSAGANGNQVGADGDWLGTIQWHGYDSAGNSTIYGFIRGNIEYASSPSEKGQLWFHVGNSGGNTRPMVLTNDALELGENVDLKFEGATSNDYETTLTVTDPTVDRTITFPDATGTVALQSWVNTQIAASSTSDLTGSVFADDSTVMVDGVNATLPNIRGTMSGHIIPGTNSVYDIGSAEYKVRHLFLSDNSLWVGDEHKIDTGGGKGGWKKRKKGIVPSGVQTLLITSVFADTNALLIDFKTQIHDPAPSNELDPDHADFNPPTSKWQEFLALHGHPNKTVDDIYNTATDFDDEKEETDQATTEGDLLYYDGSGYKRLPLGTATHVLTANGAGNAPEWSAPSGGSGSYLQEFNLVGAGENSPGSSTISMPVTTTKIEYDVVAGGGAQYDNNSSGPPGEGKTGTYIFTAGDLTALSGNSYQLTLQAGGYGGNENTGTAQPGQESWIRLNGTSIVEATCTIGARVGGGQGSYTNGTNVSPTGCIDKSPWKPSFGEGSPGRVVGFVRVRCYS